MTEEKPKMCYNLKASPLYNLSLGSKELFHSNFIAWLWNIDKTHKSFQAMLNSMGCDVVLRENDVLFREKNHFDISIERDKATVFVLENKVKSLPTFSQLKRYTNDIKAQVEGGAKFILLSLAQNIENCSEIEKLGWTICSYEKLSNSLMAFTESLKLDEYTYRIITDYRDFIRNLHELAQSWEKDIENFPVYPPQKKKGEISEGEKLDEELRLRDIHEKLYYSSLYEKLKDKILGAYELKVRLYTCGNENAHYIDEEKKTKRFLADLKRGQILLSYGYGLNGGFLDARVKVGDGLAGVVQLDGRYMRGIAVAKSYDIDKDLDNVKAKWEGFMDGSVYSYPDLNFIKPSKKQKETCQYDGTIDKMIYKHKPLGEEKTERVLDAIIEDLKTILSHTDCTK